MELRHGFGTILVLNNDIRKMCAYVCYSNIQYSHLHVLVEQKAICAVKSIKTECADSFELSVSMNQVSNSSDSVLYRKEDLNANKMNLSKRHAHILWLEFNAADFT